MKKKVIFIGILLGTLLVGCDSSETDNVNMQQTTEQISTQFKNDNAENNSPIIYVYTADLTHDGNDEVVNVVIDSTSEPDFVKVHVTENNKIIYEDELCTNYALGTQYYLVSNDENDYLMRYTPLVDHDMASASYEVFSINENGEKVIFDESQIEISLFDVAALDKASWILFADKENTYFQNAFLLVSTSEGVTNYSKPDNTIRYTEQFLWLLNEDSKESIDNIKENIDDILEKFIAETEEIYHYREKAINGNALTEDVAIIATERLNTDTGLLKQLSMVDSQNGWALTTDNQILYTANGINGFKPVKTIDTINKNTDDFVSAAFIDEATAYLSYFSDDNIIIEYTSNKGADWKQTSIPYKEYGDAYKVFFNLSDEQNGYLLYCSTPGAGLMTKILFKTVDGGESFKMISDLSSEVTGYPTGIAFSNVTNGYITTTYHGQDNYLFNTTDCGATWKSLSLSRYDSEDISYLEAYPPVFFGDNNKMGKLILKYVGLEKNSYVEYTTEDGGFVWSISGLLDSSCIESYSYYDNEDGYLIDGSGNVSCR